MLSPDGPPRQRNHFKSFCRHISLYESLPVSMREQQRRNWRHGSAAESGVGSACRPPQRSGRTVRKSAVSVKVSADGPGLLTLAVPGNQKTARGGLGGDFYAPPAHGLGRCRADRNPRVGKRVEYLAPDRLLAQGARPCDRITKHETDTATASRHRPQKAGLHEKEAATKNLKPDSYIRSPVRSVCAVSV